MKQLKTKLKADPGTGWLPDEMALTGASNDGQMKPDAAHLLQTLACRPTGFVNVSERMWVDHIYVVSCHAMPCHVSGKGRARCHISSMARKVCCVDNICRRCSLSFLGREWGGSNVHGPLGAGCLRVGRPVGDRLRLTQQECLVHAWYIHMKTC